jgi:hypothetical protein
VPLDSPSKGVTVTTLGMDNVLPIEFRYTLHWRINIGRSKPTLLILILPRAVYPFVMICHEHIEKPVPVDVTSVNADASSRSSMGAGMESTSKLEELVQLSTGIRPSCPSAAAPKVNTRPVDFSSRML